MTRYKLYTEDKNRDRIEKILADNHIDGFTVYNTSGHWKSLKEKSLVIEVLGSGSWLMNQNIKTIAEQIKAMNSQESVLITFETIQDAAFI